MIRFGTVEVIRDANGKIVRVIHHDSGRFPFPHRTLAEVAQSR